MKKLFKSDNLLASLRQTQDKQIVTFKSFQLTNLLGLTENWRTSRSCTNWKLAHRTMARESRQLPTSEKTLRAHSSLLMMLTTLYRDF